MVVVVPMSLAIPTQTMHLIMGAMSLWTRLPALYLCTGPPKKSLPRIPAVKTDSWTSSLRRAPATSTTAQELHLRHLSLHDGHDHHVPELQLWDSTVFCILNHPASIIAHQRACQQQCPRFNELQLWDLNCLLTACTRGCAGLAQPGRRTPCRWLLLGNLNGLLNWTKGNGPEKQDQQTSDCQSQGA